MNGARRLRAPVVDGRRLPLPLAPGQRDMSAPELLTFKGHPVPYITAWTGERLEQPLVVPMRGGGVTFDDLVFGRRDPKSVLWLPWALRPGDGRPDYSRVHGPRQRRAMRMQLCQVCSGPADLNEQGRLFLLEDNRHIDGWPEREVTVHPPVCLRCAPIALRLCPHLRDRAVAVRARQVVADGVYGTLYTAGVPLPVPVEKGAIRLVSEPDVRWMVGSQTAATLMDCTIVDLPGDGPQDPAGSG